MKAYVIEEHGDLGALGLRERPDELPGPGEVVVALEASALNHLDLWVRRGVPGHRFPLPLVPGSDGVGRVLALGDGVCGWKPGQRVLLAPGYGCGACHACLRGDESLCRRYLILGETRDGTCAEQIRVPAGAILSCPDGLAPADAAALPLVLTTTWRMLIRRARLAPGETVLIHAGGSGIGSTAIQIARAIGCRVITTVGNAGKRDAALALGADHVILYPRAPQASPADIAGEVRRLTQKRGVDVVVEHTGAQTWDASLRSLARGGRLVTCGATSGADARLDLRVLFFKQLELIGSTMGSRADLLEALRLVERGVLRPVVDRVFGFDALPEAHRYLEERRAFGKVVLTR